jgi:hypothetical protein
MHLVVLEIKYATESYYFPIICTNAEAFLVRYGFCKVHIRSSTSVRPSAGQSVWTHKISKTTEGIIVFRTGNFYFSIAAFFFCYYFYVLNCVRYSNPITGLERPLGFQEVEASRISRQSACEGGKVVSPKHRPPLTPKKYSWYSFLLEAESIPGP